MSVMSMDEIVAQYEIDFDLDREGIPYAIFRDNVATWDYHEHISGCGIHCWNGYENAIRLQETIGL